VIQKSVAITSDILPLLFRIGDDDLLERTNLRRRRESNRALINSVGHDEPQYRYPSRGRDEILEQLKLGVKQSGLEVLGSDSAEKVIFVRGESMDRQQIRELAAKYGYKAEWGEPPLDGLSDTQPQPTA
jgi:hypothetical protein